MIQILDDNCTCLNYELMIIVPAWTTEWSSPSSTSSSFGVRIKARGSTSITLVLPISCSNLFSMGYTVSQAESPSRDQRIQFEIRIRRGQFQLWSTGYRQMKQGMVKSCTNTKLRASLYATWTRGLSSSKYDYCTSSTWFLLDFFFLL